MILLSVTTTITGIIVLTTGSILFTISIMFTKTTRLTLAFRIIQFISVRHPLIFYGLPGIALLALSGYFAYNALDYFSSYRYVTVLLTNRLFLTVGTTIIGIILLTTGSLLYSIAAILRGRLRSD
jgi:hypothetical protein